MGISGCYMTNEMLAAVIFIAPFILVGLTVFVVHHSQEKWYKLYVKQKNDRKRQELLEFLFGPTYEIQEEQTLADIIDREISLHVRSYKHELGGADEGQTLSYSKSGYVWVDPPIVNK